MDRDEVLRVCEEMDKLQEYFSPTTASAVRDWSARLRDAANREVCNAANTVREQIEAENARLRAAVGGDTGSVERMAQAFPTLSAFYDKHALPSMLVPSCLQCGQSTPPEQVNIGHSELPNIVICSTCAARAAVVGGGWLPISEAPRDGTLFLAADADGNYRIAKMFSFWNGQWLCVAYGLEFPATAWQPLPPPPKEAKS